MGTLLLCSLDPMFLKSLYGVLRQEGHEIEIAQHPADAVRMCLAKDYWAVIMDSGNIGFSPHEAAAAIRSVCKGMPVIIAGEANPSPDSIQVSNPIDLEEVREVLRSLYNLPDFHERRVQNL